MLGLDSLAQIQLFHFGAMRPWARRSKPVFTSLGKDAHDSAHQLSSPAPEQVLTREDR